jgi:hypothetical protein
MQTIRLPFYAHQRTLLFVHQATFPQDVVLENFTPNGVAPSANKRHRVGSMEMCSECGLVSPPLGDQETAGERIVHGRVIGKISVALPRSHSEVLKILNKLGDRRGIDLDIAGNNQHQGFPW